MSRTRIAAVDRPESSPTLPFERFNPDGNSTEAVVYVVDDGILLYKGSSYIARKQIPESAAINDVFQYGKERMIVKYTPLGDGEKERHMTCRLSVVPTPEQRTKLTALFQQHGSKVVGIAEQMQAGVDQVNSLIGSLKTDVDSICPGYRFDCMCVFGDFDSAYPIQDVGDVDDLTCKVGSFLDGALELSTAEPFSKKRKSG